MISQQEIPGISYPVLESGASPHRVEEGPLPLTVKLGEIVLFLSEIAYLKSFFELNIKLLENDRRLVPTWNISPAAFQEDFTSFHKIGNTSPSHLENGHQSE